MEYGKHAGSSSPKAKRIALAASAAALCLALAGGGTIAYFTASQQAHNVITTGGVDIQLNEWADADRTIPFEDVDSVMPGMSVTKVVEVENTGEGDAWVRVKADVSVEATEGSNAQLGTDVVSMDWNMVMWTQGEDGWWYYNEPLAAGEVTYPLFNEVAFAGAGMGNPYQGSSFAVDVLAHAVQSANNGATALEAAGWPEAE